MALVLELPPKKIEGSEVGEAGKGEEKMRMEAGAEAAAAGRVDQQ